MKKTLAFGVRIDIIEKDGSVNYYNFTNKKELRKAFVVLVNLINRLKK